MWRKIFHSTLTQIIIGIIAVGLAAAIGQLGSQSLLYDTHISIDYKNVITSIAIAIMSLASYILLFHFYEKRKIRELSLSFFGKNAGIGLSLGIGLQSLVILLIYIGGGYTIHNVNPVSFVLPGFTIALSSAISEELLFRGVIFRLMELKLGSVISIIISALIFGFLHLLNKNSSLYSAFSIAVEAGVLLAVVFIYSRNLWFPIFLHFGWNFTEAGIFGAILSGNITSKSLFTAQLKGPDLLTGGAFGPENSLQAILLCFSVGLIFLYIAGRQNKFIKPYWREKKTLTINS